MTTKEKMIHAMKALPEDATYDDAMECLILLAKVDRGIAQAYAGRTISHTAIKERMAKWS